MHPRARRGSRARTRRISERTSTTRKAGGTRRQRCTKKPSASSPSACGCCWALWVLSARVLYLSVYACVEDRWMDPHSLSRSLSPLHIGRRPCYASHVYAWSNLGTVLRELGQLPESAEAHTRVRGWTCAALPTENKRRDPFPPNIEDCVCVCVPAPQYSPPNASTRNGRRWRSCPRPGTITTWPSPIR